MPNYFCAVYNYVEKPDIRKGYWGYGNHAYLEIKSNNKLF